MKYLKIILMLILVSPTVMADTFTPDTFEDGKTDDWVENDAIFTTSEEALDGSYSADLDIQGNNVATAESTGGDPRIPGVGDTIIMSSKARSNHGTLRIRFGDGSGTSIGYGIYFDNPCCSGSNIFELKDGDGNTKTENFNPSADKWYRFKTEINENNFTTKIYDKYDNKLAEMSKSHSMSEFSNINYGYGWYNEGTGAYFDGTTQNNVPTVPSNPEPENDSKNIQLEPELSAYYSDPDGDSGTLNFYTSNGSFIDSCSLDNNSICSINYSSADSYSEQYSWYAIGDDGNGGQSNSPTWTFETRHNVSASLSGPSQTPADLNPSLSATISHSDPHEHVTATFINEDNGNVLKKIDNVQDGESVGYDTTEDAFGNSSGQTYNWKVNISGDQSSEQFSSAGKTFTTVDDPNFSNPKPIGDNISTSYPLSLDVNRPDNLDMDITFRIDENQDGTYTTVGTDTVTGGRGTASINPELKKDTAYDWKADIYTQGYSNTRKAGEWNFTTSNSSTIEIKTNNTQANNPELNFKLDESVEELKIINESGDTVAIESETDKDTSLDVLTDLDPNTRYEWTAEASTPTETRTLNFSFNTIQIKLEVEEVEKAESYNIYRSKEEDEDYSLVGRGKPDNSNIILDGSNSLVENEKYCYKITALTKEGIESKQSNRECLAQPTEVNTE